MPNKWTFQIKPIRKLLEEEMDDGYWVDPFAGTSKLATVTNDLNPDMDTDYHMDAHKFLKTFEDNSVDGVLYDPPYSVRQIKECYNSVGYSPTQLDTSNNFYKRIKLEIARIVRPRGKVISCGWNSAGIGKTLGFEIKRILLVPHGGHHNDTIVTVDVKINQTLE